MPTLLERVRRYALQHALWTPATRVVAAVSGGSDSVALLFLLRELAASGDVVLAGLAHLHHHIRGEAADGDARFCRDLAARFGVTSLVGDADVPGAASRERVSIEVAGRQARQAFFLQACEAFSAERVAVAHTRDDQAETVLLRLVRGAGPTGLAGMSPRNSARIRPVLDVTRVELRAYLAGLGEPWREDATNEDRANPRNRMRHEVLPLLRDRFNPQVTAALARTADILRGDTEFFDALAVEAADRCISQGTHCVLVDAAGLAALPAAVARRVALRALRQANPGRAYGLEEADAVWRTASGRTSGSLPGVEMERSGAAVILTGTGGSSRPGVSGKGGSEGVHEPPELLPIPGEARGPLGRWTVRAAGPIRVLESAVPGKAENGRQKAEGTGRYAEEPDDARVVVDAVALGTGLIVRGRLPGDRLQPLGAAGRKKVQDVLVDRKVPRDERDHVPIVTDSSGRIVWVAGHVLAEPFRVTPLTTTVVILTLGRQ